MAKDDTAKAKFVPLDWVAWPVIGVKAEKISMVLWMRYFTAINALNMLLNLSIFTKIFVII